ncbi:MAG TPA: NF038129 family PEP-CTERM protein [Candidatus Acidoferrum sp.]|jgi:hypothetical protein|nr:NF038129 family PEP-CTERM protein [Candidatus Acidoferrum sp.]
MNKKLTNIASLVAGAFVLSSAASSHAAEYLVTIQTSPLNSSALSANGPFQLDLQLNYGTGGIGNTATVNNFSFGGGGSAVGTPTYLSGLVAGSLNSAVTLSDNASSQFNEFDQVFNPGTSISFDVTLSNNPGGQTPDGFVVDILDNGNAPILTSAPDQIGLAELTVGGFGQITTGAYAGVNNTDPNNANEAELGDYSGVTTTVSVAPVPEPSSIGILALGLGVGGWFVARRKAARA